MSNQGGTTGSCRCGQVRITARGAPLMTFACHCTGCQRMTASAFSLSAMYPEAAVTIEGDAVLGGMRGELRHHFCPSCLSWVYTTAPIMGPMVNIRTTMLDDAPRRNPPSSNAGPARSCPGPKPMPPTAMKASPRSRNSAR